GKGQAARAVPLSFSAPARYRGRCPGGRTDLSSRGMDCAMASRTRLATGTIGLLLLLLTGCLEQRMNRDRYRAIRNDVPPRPQPTLQIPTPPNAALASGNTGVQPASYVPPERANPPVQPATFTQ